MSAKKLQCDKCEAAATIEIKGHIYPWYFCSDHASKLCQALGGTPDEVEAMRIYA